ncbi:MAG: response regulator [Pseudomonadota bacterium]
MTPVLKGVKALIVEDNLTNQIVAREMLAYLGAQTVIVGDGIEALDALAAETFDLLIIDIEMPRLTGTELIRRLRVPNGRHADTAMVALTAYVMQENCQAIEQAGADGIIAKPLVSIERFGEVLSAVLERRRQLRAAAAPEQAWTAQTANGVDTTPTAVVDERALVSLAEIAGDVGVATLISSALTELETAVAELLTAIETGDLDRTRFVSHSLAGMAGSVGAVGLERQARAINDDPEAALIDARRHGSMLRTLLSRTLSALAQTRARFAGETPWAPAV